MQNRESLIIKGLRDIESGTMGSEVVDGDYVHIEGIPGGIALKKFREITDGSIID